MMAPLWLVLRGWSGVARGAWCCVFLWCVYVVCVCGVCGGVCGVCGGGVKGGGEGRRGEVGVGVWTVSRV